MGRGLFERFPRETRAADAVLGYSIRSLCLDDDDDRLIQTQYTQPAMYVVSALAYLDRLRTDPSDPDFFIGHSLGEFVALFGAGAFDFETGLRLVQRRGALMSRCPRGSMAAVIGCDQASVEVMLRESGVTSVDVANVNSHSQTVLSGPVEDIARLRPVVEARDAIFIPLKVDTPFHSRYMLPAAEEFEQALAETEFEPLRVPVIANVTAAPYRNGQVRDTLARQIPSPVQWLDSVRYLMREGDFSFVELGPGKVLTRLVSKIRARYARP